VTVAAVHRIGMLALTVVVAAYGLLVARDFFRLSDHLVYLAVDDALANQSVMIATEGRYGFISSPIVLDIPRHYGEVTYGPFYFFTGAGLVWLFGTSLTIVRSVHLWVVVGAAVAARRWFGGLNGAIAAAIFGFTAFFMFDRAMWPMARPDSIVTAFAIALTVAGGLAIRSGRARDWFLAGLSASCGAFAHLIAWTFVPTCLVLFAVWAVLMAPRQFGRDAVRAQLLRAFIALAVGGVLGALMFYGSFGFRFGDQLRMFDAYERLIETSAGYWATLGGHLEYAFSFMSNTMRAAFVLAIGASIAVAAVLLRQPDTRTAVLTWLLPPLLLWAAYLISNGWYTNHHQGYAILHQVMGAWCIAAGAATFLHALELQRPAAWKVVAPVAAVMLMVQGATQIGAHLERTSMAVQQARRWASIDDFTDRVLAPVPAGAAAWGSIIFGIDAPERVQLVQFADAVELMERIAPERRVAFAPDYLISGYPEIRDLAVTVLQGEPEPSVAHRVRDLLAGSPYQLISIVAAHPYGVTRVYARTAAQMQPEPLPAIDVFEPRTERWLNGIGDPMAVPFASAPPLPLRIGYGPGAGERLPAGMMTASLPRGVYLLRVALRPGAGRGERLVATVSEGARSQTIGALGPDGDFATYGDREQVVTLLSVHEGGVLHVSQFDEGAGAALQGVEVRPVFGLQPPDEHSWRAVRATEFTGPWTPSPGVEVVSDASGAWHVQGDASPHGYQIVGAPLIVRTPQSVEVSLDIAAEQGAVCTGVLDDGQERWIVAPTRLHDRLSFDVGEPGRVWIVVANCASDGRPVPASRFTVRSATVLMRPDTLYTDRLMDAAFAGR
jgi:hypothetical protein